MLLYSTHEPLQCFHIYSLIFSSASPFEQENRAGLCHFLVALYRLSELTETCASEVIAIGLLCDTDMSVR